MKKSLLLVLGLGIALNACSHKEEESFTKAASYPASCQSDPRFSLFLNQYNHCTRFSPEKVDVCLRNDLIKLGDGINATCKSEPSTRSLFGKALLKLVRIVWSGVKDEASQESALKLTTFWLTNYRAYYISPGQPVVDDIVPLERAIQDALREENARLSRLELDGYSKEIQNYADSGAVSDNGLYLDSRLGFLDQTTSIIANGSPGLPVDAASLLAASALTSVLDTLMPRLTYAANIHDLACAAIQCSPSDLTDYDYMRTFKFLSLLNRGAYSEAKAIGDMGPASKLKESLFAKEAILQSTFDTMSTLEAERLSGARPSDLARDIKQTLTMADELYQRQQSLGYFSQTTQRPYFSVFLQVPALQLNHFWPQ